MNRFEEIDAERIALKKKSFDESLKTSPLFQELLKLLSEINKSLDEMRAYGQEEEN
jgi:hypothetical protein